MSPIDSNYFDESRKTKDLHDLLDALHGPRSIFLQDLLTEVLLGQQPRKSKNLVLKKITVNGEPNS